MMPSRPVAWGGGPVDGGGGLRHAAPPPPPAAAARGGAPPPQAPIELVRRPRREMGSLRNDSDGQASEPACAVDSEPEPAETLHAEPRVPAALGERQPRRAGPAFLTGGATQGQQQERE